MRRASRSAFAERACAVLAGGKADKSHLTQFARATQQLGIEMIPAYSLEARGRSERAFRTHQERLPRELALAGSTDMRMCTVCSRSQYVLFRDATETVAGDAAAGSLSLWIRRSSRGTG